MDYLLYFILGFIVGGSIAFFTVAAISVQRISHYERMNEKQHWQIKRLADSLPKESRKNILSVDLCVCCGEHIPEGQMICTRCLRDN